MAESIHSNYMHKAMLLGRKRYSCAALVSYVIERFAFIWPDLAFCGESGLFV